MICIPVKITLEGSAVPSCTGHADMSIESAAECLTNPDKENSLQEQRNVAVQHFYLMNPLLKSKNTEDV